MWRARLLVYGMAILIALGSGFVHSLPDPNVRSVLGLGMNLAAIPVVELVLQMFRKEAKRAVTRAERDERVVAARRRATPPASGPLR
jgi:hypothetical protein